MRIAMLLGAIALAGYAAHAAPLQKTKAERAERELADALKGRVAGVPQDCISWMQGSGPQIVDSRTLIYRQAGRVYRNDLEGGCPGLDWNDTLITEIHGSSICRNDTIRVRETGSSIIGRTCFLGKFTPYTKAK